MVFPSQSTVSLRGCRPHCELRCAVALEDFSPTKDQELVAQAISNYVRSLIAAHLADVNARDEHTVKPWFTREMEILAPSREWREDKQNLGRSIAPEGLQDSAQGFNPGKHSI